jgi:phosphoribosylglycinamide formyltransferase-1
MPLKIAVLVSGGGTNLQAILDGCRSGIIDGEVVLVASNRAGAYGLERARIAGVETMVLPREERYESLADRLDALGTDLIVLAGYLEILPGSFVGRYQRRIINIHPSLLPKFGGKDHYGLKVHEAVIASGDEESGATVHFVDAGVDTGEIIERKKITVAPSADASSLQRRVLAIEHRLLIDVVKRIASGSIEIGGSNQ